MKSLKVGSYLIFFQKDGITESAIAQIISFDSEAIRGKTIIDEYTPETIGYDFTLETATYNAECRLATEEETININKRLIFK